MTWTLRLFVCGLLLAATACVPPSDEPPTTPPKPVTPTATISGTVQGLEGIGLSLTLTAPGVVETKDLSRTSETFAFDAKVAIGGSYTVFIAAEPVSPRQACSLMHQEGLVPEAGVNDVSVTCTTLTGNVGGKITGLTSTGLVLRNTVNGQQTDLTIAATQDSYTFTDLKDDVLYEISVAAQPAGAYCAVDPLRAKGAVDASHNVVNIDVTCEPSYTLSGAVHGLSGSTGVVLTLTSEIADETLVVPGGASPVAFSFVTRLPKDTLYAVDVAAQPAERQCTARAPLASGAINMANVSDVSVTCVGRAVPTYANAPRFGQWLTTADPANACDQPSLATARGECLHAGERRSVFVPGVSACPATPPADALGVFDWSCRTASDGIELYSRGFKPGKRLIDLLEFGSTVTWRKNRVTFVEQGIDVRSAESADWFSNVIAAIAPSGPITSGANETIQVVATGTGLGGNVARSLSVNAPSVIVVVAPGVSLVDPVVVPAELVDWTGSFGWFEGTVSSRAATAIAVHAGRFDTLRGVRVVGPSGAVTTAIATDGFAATVQDVQLARARLTMNGSEHLLKDANVYNGGGLVVTGDRHVIVDSQLSAVQGSAVDLANGSDVFIGNVTIANVDGAAIHASNVSGGFVTNLAVANARPIAIELAASDDWTFESLAVSGTTSDLDFTTSSDRARFFGRVALGAGVIGLSGTTGNTIDTTGVAGGSGPVVTGPFAVSGSFVGAVVADQRNLTARNPQGEATVSATFDWLNFENSRRGWGKPRGSYAFGASELGGPCVLQCQIWDWSLALSSLELRGVNASPVVTATPVNTHGTVTYVRGAIEIFGDAVGNDNGFCEAGERCVYTPNIGRAQGRGAATETAPQSFGPVSDVSLTSFATF